MKVTNSSAGQTAALQSAKPKEKVTSKEATRTSQALPGSDATTAGVEISEKAQLMRQATEIAQQTPSVRRDRVEDLRNQILAGKYKVDAGAVADKILEDHLGSDFGKNNL